MDPGQFLDGTSVAALLGLGYLVFSVERLKRTLTGRGEPREITGQPVRVAITDQPQTVGACQDLHAQLGVRIRGLEKKWDRMELEMRESHQQIMEAGSRRAKDIHQRIDPLISRIGELTGAVRGLRKESE
ncbi:MAG TPA: hypothetical protein PLU30_23550 [Verrucomicrobiae bacterium]|nr:hypothetical protein [Verrucomicrobiae bacterium]